MNSRYYNYTNSDEKSFYGYEYNDTKNNRNDFYDEECQTELFCNYHKQMKENILLENAGEYKKFTSLCPECLSSLERNLNRRLENELFVTVIEENKNFILYLKNKKIDLSSLDKKFELEKVREGTIGPYHDNMNKLKNEFQERILNRIFSKGHMDLNKLNDVQKFIETIELLPNGNPNLRNIGSRKDLQSKYIKLAMFLIKYNSLNDYKDFFNDTEANHYGINNILKEYIKSFIANRKNFIDSSSYWLKYLIGDFYKYTTNLEKIPIDTVFEKEVTKDITFSQNTPDFNKFDIKSHKDFPLLMNKIETLERENNDLKGKNLINNLIIIKIQQG